MPTKLREPSSRPAPVSTSTRRGPTRCPAQHDANTSRPELAGVERPFAGVERPSLESSALRWSRAALAGVERPSLESSGPRWSRAALAGVERPSLESSGPRWSRADLAGVERSSLESSGPRWSRAALAGVEPVVRRAEGQVFTVGPRSARCARAVLHRSDASVSRAACAQPRGTQYHDERRSAVATAPNTMRPSDALPT
jgi:hypothetical protein